MNYIKNSFPGQAKSSYCKKIAATYVRVVIIYVRYTPVRYA